MLHRTPSGAQRKIKQRRDERLQQVRTTSTSSENGASNINGNNSPGYRNLVDSNDYQSILPDDNWRAPFSVSPFPRFGQSTERLSQKPERPPRQNETTENKPVDPPHRKPEADIPLIVSRTTADGFSTGFTGKPTVQVHPMPAPRTISPHTSPSESFKKQPPPVPKKPSGLRPKSEYLHTRNALSEDRNDFSHSAMQQDSVMQPCRPSPAFSLSSLSTATSPLGTLASVSSATSTDSLHMLCTSPSLLNLQNSLHYAACNPELHTRERLEELETQRLQSIERLSKRVAEREEDRKAILEDLDANEELRATIFRAVPESSSLKSRLNIHVVQCVRLTQLETRLQLQMEKLQNFEREAEELDEGFIKARRRRLAEQLEDARLVRDSFNARDAELDNELRQELRDDELLKEWQFYKTTLRNLHAEKKQIEDKISHVKAQLKTLTSTAIPVPSDSGDSHSSDRVSYAYSNQKKLDAESKKLEKHAANLLQSTEQWVSQIDSFNQALKEIGDVESWSKAIETDMTIVLNTLQEVHKGKTAGKASNDDVRPPA
ncbi:biogenesis of lysosome-related organelles complex 1 subunit 1 [Aphelenchoides avenae]|nr:biogenesis of lysosome-related organelles complex 1 subunit 1 [Aphelenchus avenae]